MSVRILKPQGGRARRRPESTVEERLRAMAERTPEQVAEDRDRLLSKARPARPLPPGRTLEEVVVGVLPGEESEEEIRAALAELS